MARANKKVFIFHHGNCTMNVRHPSLSKSFALSNCSRNPIKTQPCNTFSRVSTAKCTSSCNHDGSLEDNSCVPFLKLKFLIPTLRHIFCLPKPLKIYGESYFVSSVSRNTLGKCTILWFKKRDFYF